MRISFLTHALLPVLLAVLTAGGIGAQAQSTKDTAAYARWKNGLVVQPTNYVARQGINPPGQLRGGTNVCDCWIPPDATYTLAMPPNDDQSSALIPIPFTFNLYGDLYTSLYINNNGNVSFGSPWGTFSSSTFPTANFAMVAPFWADVDTRPVGGGQVWYKVTPTAIYVNWVAVGYFSMQTNMLNTFQLILTDGNDPVIGMGRNVSFCYQDMQWTTGSASGGVNGFGGTPATVGANRGNGIDFLQFTQTDQPGTAYDGPFGNPDGVSWLDFQSFTFNTNTSIANVPPVITGQSACDSLVLCVGQNEQLQVTFIAPEPQQTTVATAVSSTLTGMSVTTTTGIAADVIVNITPLASDTGYHIITFTGTDNGSPPLSSVLDLVVHVVPVSPFPDTSITLCGDTGNTDLYQLMAAIAQPGGTWEDPNGNPHSGIFQPGTDPDGRYRYLEGSGAVCPRYGDVYVTTYLTTNTMLVDSTQCSGSTDGSITVSTTGTAGAWNYVWTNALGGVVRTTNNASTDTYTGAAGTYTIIVTEGPNGIGCDDTLTATIQEPTDVTVALLMDDTTICKTGSAYLAATGAGGTGAIALNWSQGLAGSGPHTVSLVSTTTFTVFASDANGCVSDTLDVTVTVRPDIAFTMPDTVPICPEVDLTLSALPVTGGDGAYLFDWGNGPGLTPYHTVNLTASELVCVTVNDGCETPLQTRCTYVSVIPIPELVLTADSTLGCEPFAVQLSIADTTTGADVLWDFGDGITAEGLADIGHTYPDPGGFDVSVVVTWPNGCQDDTTITDMIVVAPLADADFSWTPNPGSVLTPELTFTENAGPYATQYIWDFAGMASATGPVAQYTFPDQVGFTYPVELLVTNYLGCADSVVKMVEIRDEFLVYVPDAFTPDGDGINDMFLVRGNDIDPKEFELLVFNRWGELVFRSTDPSKGWTGAMNGGDGEPVQDGVYPWRLRLASKYSQERREIFGHVTLIH